MVIWPASRNAIAGNCAPSQTARSGSSAMRAWTLIGEQALPSANLIVSDSALRLSEGFDALFSAALLNGSGAPRTDEHRPPTPGSVSFLPLQTAPRHGSRTSGPCEAPQ